MESELDKPLGQHRRVRDPHGGLRRLRGGAVTAFIVAAGLFAGGAYTALQPLGVREPSPARGAPVPGARSQTDAAGAPARAAAPAAPKAAAALPAIPQDGQSGATIEKTLTSNGLTVTTLSPAARSTDGPALIAVGRAIGQPQAVASQPDPALVEDSRFGKLPQRGPKGERPMDVYARPWSQAGGTRIAIIVGGLGLSQTGTMNAIAALPPEVTLGFAATGNSLQRWMQQARQAGHEIVLQVPMQPFDYPANDPGPQTLTVSAPQRQTLDHLHEAMGRMTNYTGVMNYLGGRFMSDADAFTPVMRDIAKRGLLFLDDGTASRSLTDTLAPTLGVPYATADLQLDQTLDRDAILKRLGDLEDLARRNGSAIGVASAFDESVGAIAQWANDAKARGIEIVGVSALVKDPERGN